MAPVAATRPGTIYWRWRRPGFRGRPEPPHNPGRFTDLDDLATRILAFQDRYNANAEPFDWRYTRDDLNAFLNRLTAA